MKTKTQEARDQDCPQCGSKDIKYDEDFAFYKCSDCEHCWGYDEGDPDYNELDENLDDVLDCELDENLDDGEDLN